MSKRTILFAIGAPVALWLGFVVIGRKRADNAGTAVFNDRGLLLPFEHGLLLETAAAGALVAYLTG